MALARRDYATAASHYTLALARNPLHSEVWFSLGFCHLKEGSLDDATTAFTRAVQLDAENGEAWNNLGVLHLRARRHAPAFTALGVALRAKAAHWQARLLRQGSPFNANACSSINLVCTQAICFL
jgi:Flp pilus assembly protein TadD